MRGHQRIVPVTRLRDTSTRKDQYGQKIPGVPQQVSLPPARFAPGETSEPIAPGAEPVISQPTLYWRRAWPDVVSSDQLLVDGITYEVDGEPKAWPKGLVVALKGVTS